MAFLRKYATGSGADIYITMVKRAVVDHAVGADWTPAAGDVKVSIDGAASANIGTLPVAVAMGNSAEWKFVFTNAELTGKVIVVTIADSATKAVEDNAFIIETYGNASALHPFDLSVATQPVNVTQLLGTAWLTPAVAGTPDVNTKLWGGTAVASAVILAAANIAADAFTAAKFAAASLNGKGDWNIGKTGYALSAAGVQAIWDALTSALLTVGSIGKLLVDNIDAAISSRLASASYTTPPTVGAIADQVWDESKLAHVGANTFGEQLNNLTVALIADQVWDEAAAGHVAAGSFGALAADLPTTAEFEARTLIAASYATSAVCTEVRLAELDAANLPADVAARATPAQVNAEVLDVLNVDTFTEPGQEAPAATNTLTKKIGYLFKMLINKKTQTATERKLFNAAGAVVDQKATDSDDATTYTKGQLGTGP